MHQAWKPIVAVVVACGFVALLFGCQSSLEQGEILLAYSADCQAYLEPCG